MIIKRASVRRNVVINRKADEVWRIVGDPSRVQDWFIGIASSTVEGTTRVIVTNAGLSIPEEIITNDPIQRRFQYRIVAPMVREHLSTLDVIEIDDEKCMVTYSADADPAVMALVIAGAAGNALKHLRSQMEESR
ncbi:MAG TPA: SRPBCC family protein [Acidimicrobiales bacterium]|nr:SRPBCC family protein [Acidimicrobiales bacterium]